MGIMLHVWVPGRNVSVRTQRVHGAERTRPLDRSCSDTRCVCVHGGRVGGKDSSLYERLKWMLPVLGGVATSNARKSTVPLNF